MIALQCCGTQLFVHVSPNFTLLTGHNPVVAVHTHIQGKAPLGGTFQVKFRGQGPSYPIPYNGDMFDMRDALESIVTIDAVQVSALTGSFPNSPRGKANDIMVFCPPGGEAVKSNDIR